MQAPLLPMSQFAAWCLITTDSWSRWFRKVDMRDCQSPSTRQHLNQLSNKGKEYQLPSMLTIVNTAAQQVMAARWSENVLFSPFSHILFQVEYFGPARGGYHLGSCFPNGGTCGGTPQGCQDCNKVIICWCRQNYFTWPFLFNNII